MLVSGSEMEEHVSSYFAMILPGTAILTVHFRPSRGVNSADGFDVSSSFPFFPTSRFSSTSPRLFFEGGCPGLTAACEKSSSFWMSKTESSFFPAVPFWRPTSDILRFC